jgi:hypothetical protein
MSVHTRLIWRVGWQYMVRPLVDTWHWFHEQSEGVEASAFERNRQAPRNVRNHSTRMSLLHRLHTIPPCQVDRQHAYTLAMSERDAGTVISNKPLPDKRVTAS